jgi:hypothetical protein
MADLADVENALVSLIAATVYPNGTGQPSIANVGIAVYRGWPQPKALEDDLAAVGAGTGGKVHISVFTRPEEHNVTRYPKDWQQQSAPAPTLTLTVNGQQVTVGGTVSTPQNAVVFVNNAPFVYVVQANDTPTTIAAALAALINAGSVIPFGGMFVPVPGPTSAGPVITMPASARMGVARVGASGISIMEVRRQERTFQITVWANSEANRSAIAGPLDAALANTLRFTLPDQTSARLIYKGSPVLDGVEKSNLYRRDLLYSVEYATTVTETDTQVTAEQLNVSNQIDGATAISATTILFQ